MWWKDEKYLYPNTNGCISTERKARQMKYMNQMELPIVKLKELRPISKRYYTEIISETLSYLQQLQSNSHLLH
jgi:hypothetical protein